MLAILTPLIAAIDFKVCTSNDHAHVKTVSLDPEQPVHGKAVHVTIAALYARPVGVVGISEHWPDLMTVPSSIAAIPTPPCLAQARHSHYRRQSEGGGHGAPALRRARHTSPLPYPAPPRPFASLRPPNRSSLPVFSAAVLRHPHPRLPDF